MKRFFFLNLIIICFSSLNCTDNSTDINTDIDDIDVDTGPREYETDVAIDTDFGDRVGMNDPDFTRHLLSTNTTGAAYVSVADITGDGWDDLVVSAFGAITGSDVPLGTVTLFESTGQLDTWKRSPVMKTEDGISFPNATTLEDIDGDGDLDILLSAGFFPCTFFNSQCGALIWFEQRGSRWERHDIVPNGSELYYHHTILVDMDGDGLKDIITVGENRHWGDEGMVDRAIVQMIRGTDDKDRFEKTIYDLGAGLGALPEMRDVDGDGDLDIASAEYFTEFEKESFAWFEQLEAPSSSNPTGSWQRHVIADDVGGGIQFSFVPNLLGDGQTYGVGSNHSSFEVDGIESAVYIFPLPTESAALPWPGRTKITEGILSRTDQGMFAPGVFGYGDIDSDGDIDIALSGDGDPRVFVLLQTEDHTFETRALQPNFGQAGGQKIVDLDRDGKNEVVMTSYDQSAVAVFEWKGL